MNNKIFQLHLEAIENNICSESNYSKILGREDASKKSAEITEHIAIEFAEFVTTYPDKNKNYLGEILHSKSKYDGAETTKHLFQEFLKTKQ